MKTKLALIAVCHLLSAVCFSAFAQGTAFTYQGRLNDGAAPANGSYDLQFAIYDAASDGLKQAPFVTNSAAAVSNGLFTVTLDFGTGVFPGAPRWLDIGVRTNGGGTFTLLAPRQALTATPYAIFAGGASNLVGAVSSANLAGTYAQAVTLNNPGNVFAGNGAGVTNVNAVTLNGLGSGAFWQLGGNNVSAGQFLGSTNDQAVEIKVNGLRALRLEPTADSPNVIGGFSGNFVGVGYFGSTIAGGGGLGNNNRIFANYATIAGGHYNDIGTNSHSSAIGGGYANTIAANSPYATIAGGINNDIGTNSGSSAIGGGYDNNIAANSLYATIAGGYFHTIAADSQYAAIAGGYANNIGTNSVYSAVGGGRNNTIAANSESAIIAGGYFNDIGTISYNSAIGGGFNNNIGAISAFATIAGGYLNDIGTSSTYSTIGGGYDNNIAANSLYATIAGGNFNDIGTNSSTSAIGGGYNNNIAANSESATIAGGIFNDIGANSSDSAIGGGFNNNIADNARFATIPGGENNAATNYAFAAGRRAKANHTGAFVWGDSTFADFASTAANQFLVRASGGVGINTTNPVVALTVEGSGIYNEFGAAAIVVRNTTANKSWEWHVLDSGNMQLVDFSAAATRLTILTNGNITVPGNLSANSFNPTSDRNAKENFKPVNAQDVLAKVTALPISQWNFKQDTAVQHVGPMAQDFRAAFGLGLDDKHIATVDADGVALAAIQGLNQKLEEQKTENAQLKARLEKLERLINEKIGGGK